MVSCSKLLSGDIYLKRASNKWIQLTYVKPRNISSHILAPQWRIPFRLIFLGNYSRSNWFAPPLSIEDIYFMSMWKHAIKGIGIIFQNSYECPIEIAIHVIYLLINCVKCSQRYIVFENIRWWWPRCWCPLFRLIKTFSLLTAHWQNNLHIALTYRTQKSIGRKIHFCAGN